MKDKNISETPSFHDHYRSISGFTQISIGKPKFAELRPKYVLYSSDLQQNVCIYLYIPRECYINMSSFTSY